MKRLKQLKQMPSDTVYDQIDSPVGPLTLFASSTGLYNILWQEEGESEDCKAFLINKKKQPNNKILKATKQQLAEYFAGKRKTFSIPLHRQGTPFQLQAWEALCTIPYGETISYGEQAKRLGDKNKARAVGMANGMNPISIIVPCHRVIGSNGKLTGFGGGLENKLLLLELERRHSQP